MSFDECIINGQREGSITDNQARYARDLFEQNRADMIEELGQEGAAAAAARETFDQLKYEAARKKQLALLKIKKFKELNERLKNTTGSVTGDTQRPGLALQAMVAIDESMKRFDANLHSTYEATRRTALSRFSDGLRAKPRDDDRAPGSRRRARSTERGIRRRHRACVGEADCAAMERHR